MRKYWTFLTMNLITNFNDNATYRLANAIRKAQKRANALENVVLPRFQKNIKYITDALEEKEREAFTRQKVIKRQKDI